LGEYTLRPFGRDAIRTFAVRWFAPTDDEPQRPPPDDFIKAVEVGGLAQLVEVPLLATISAIVYEEAVGQSLPIDRAGLYEKFVSVLLTLRRSQPGAVDVVRQQLRGSSPAAEEYGRFVYERRRQCLSFLAARLLVDKVGPADALTEWVRNQAEPMPADVTVDQVREILVGTGLVVPRGEDIVFLHQSFAEYLASLALVPAFRPRTWLKGVRDHGADSLGLFRFAAWVRAGNDPMPIVTDLLREHRQRRYPHLRDVAAMIEDGGILVGSGEAAVDAVWHAVRRGSSLTPAATGRRQRSPDEPDPVVGDMLRAVYQRSRGSNRLADMVTDRTVRVVKRVQAAEILIKDGSPDERDRTVDDLVDLAYRARLSDYDRLWALYYLAKYGGDRERPHALQRMTAMVETSQWLPVRSRALALLAETGEVIAGAAALARRAMDSRYSVAERLSTLELLTTFLVLEARPDTPPDPYAAGLELDEGVWRQPPRLRSAGFGNDRRVETYIAQLRTVIVRIARQDPVTADHLAQRFVRDRGITWIRRAHLIRGLRAAGFADIADAALLAVAYDSGEPAYNRVAMLELKRFDNHFRRDDESFAILTAWIYDEDQPPVLRSAALGSMLRDSPAEDIRRVAGDRRLPVRMRTSAAFQLTGTRPGIAEAQVALRAMATEEALSLPDRVTVDFGRALLAVTGRTVDLVRLLGTAFAIAFRRVPVPRRRRAVPAEQGQPPA
jgi:hypothetical protein